MLANISSGTVINYYGRGALSLHTSLVIQSHIVPISLVRRLTSFQLEPICRYTEPAIALGWLSGISIRL